MSLSIGNEKGSMMGVTCVFIWGARDVMMLWHATEIEFMIIKRRFSYPH